MKNFNQLLEDLYASDFKEKEFMGPDGKWHKRKLRPHRVDFKASKMRAEPAQKDSGEDVGMKEETTPYWKKPSFNKRMSQLAKQERLAREKKEAEQKNVKEETEMTIDEQINEVLSKDATAGDWIHDFVHSDNPKFAGKSKEKRKQMALAAYYAKQRNEEVEIEETCAPVAPTLDKKYIKGTPENKAYKATKKPINGMPTNVKEEVKTTHEDPLVVVRDSEGNIHTHANLSVANAIHQANVKHQSIHTGKPVQSGKFTFELSKHHAGAMKEETKTLKTFKEMVDQITEKSEQAKKNKMMKNVMDASKGAQHNRLSGLDMKPSDTGHKTAQQMNKAIGRALRREESEYDLEYTKTYISEELGLDLTDDQILAIAEALKGGQKKLDKNKNGKLDSQDFKILRGEDEMHEETCPVCHKDPCECNDVKESRQMHLRSGVVKLHPNGVESDTEEGWETPEPAGGKTKKEFKESAEKRTVSFSDFINEIKMADLPRRTIKGSSYGAQYHDPEGDDEDTERKQVAKSEPAVKRGRGRPAGSKSGANQKVTSGTKRTGVDYTGYKLHLPNTNR